MKMVRGEDKNQGEGYIFKTEIFQIIYLTTCTFQNDSASVGKSPGPYCGKIPHFQAEMFPIGYLTTCDFKNASASGGKPPDPH